MYFPTDKLYIETKSIKLGEKAIKEEYQILANWSKQQLDITILNVFYSLKNNNTLPSLRIVIEFQKDYNLLHGAPNNPYNQKYNKLIASKYLEIIKELKIDISKKFKAKDFHMTYSVFSKVAIIECLNKLSKSDFNPIKEKYGSNGLWTISNHHGSIVVFYTEESEIAKNDQSGISKQIENDIIILASQNDEFKYLEEEIYFFGFDSKEKFDKKHNGNWNNYYR